MKKVTFHSNVSKGYKFDDSIKLSFKITDEEYSEISLIFQKYKKLKKTSHFIIEEFLKEFLMDKINKEIEELNNADV